MAKITAKLKDTANFLKDVLKGFTELINKDLAKRKRTIEQDIRAIVLKEVYDSPELSALRNGKLSFDLGLPESEDPSPLIARAVADTVSVSKPNFRVNGRNIVGNYRIEIQPQDFSNLLSQSFGSVITEKGQELPWLAWLLVEGDSIIVANWQVQYGNFGRSGGAQMIPGGAFTVDARFSGTIDDNFVTRSLRRSNDEILKTFMGK